MSHDTELTFEEAKALLESLVFEGRIYAEVHSVEDSSDVAYVRIPTMRYFDKYCDSNSWGVNRIWLSTALTIPVERA